MIFAYSFGRKDWYYIDSVSLVYSLISFEFISTLHIHNGNFKLIFEMIAELSI